MTFSWFLLVLICVTKKSEHKRFASTLKEWVRIRLGVETRWVCALLHHQRVIQCWSWNSHLQSFVNFSLTCLSWVRMWHKLLYFRKRNKHLVSMVTHSVQDLADEPSDGNVRHWCNCLHCWQFQSIWSQISLKNVIPKKKRHLRTNFLWFSSYFDIQKYITVHTWSLDILDQCGCACVVKLKS